MLSTAIDTQSNCGCQARTGFFKILLLTKISAEKQDFVWELKGIISRGIMGSNAHALLGFKFKLSNVTARPVRKTVVVSEDQ
jgi:hypothetical protein